MYSKEPQEERFKEIERQEEVRRKNREEMFKEVERQEEVRRKNREKKYKELNCKGKKVCNVVDRKADVGCNAKGSRYSRL